MDSRTDEALKEIYERCPGEPKQWAHESLALVARFLIHVVMTWPCQCYKINKKLNIKNRC